MSVCLQLTTVRVLFCMFFFYFINMTTVAAQQGALALTSKLHDAHAFTDTSKFSLRCLVCGAGLAGEDDAMKHAQGTKPPHTNFAEYKA